jgi:CubicO group peptidase (beta-lactamase class C family)
MRRRRFSSLLGGTALASLAGVPAFAEPPEGCGVPGVREDGWAVVSFDNDKLIDRAALCEATDRLVASGANIHSVLVVRGGKLVFERYFKGLDEIPDDIFGRRVANVAFDADTLHDVKSVSKSVASLAVGIAIDQGLIRNVNEPIFSFFPELADLRTLEKDRILLRHVLDMTMGLEWVEATPATGDFANDEARMHMAADQCRYVLGLAVTAPAGQEFHYSTGALALVSAIVRKATGRPLDEFARANLFDRLGISAGEWRRVRGDTDAGGGLRLRSREMAKIGQLVLAGGRWNEHQVVSRSWIEASTAPIIKATDDQLYGYLWWLGRARGNGRVVSWIGALGRGGQSIRIVPELDLVVVVTAGYYQDYSPKAFQVQFGVFRDVVRATLPLS